MRTIYIAAPFDDREQAATAAATLGELGLKSTATWITKHTRAVADLKAWELAQEARTDLQDIDRADCFVLLNDTPNSDKSTTGGRHFEMGYALARGKEVFLIGPRTSVFHFLTAVNPLESLEDIQAWL